MKILSILFVLVGVALLIAALTPTHNICKRQQPISSGWKFLGVLISFFIFGYLLFEYMLISAPPTFLRFIVSLILCGGGVFVFLVVRLSGVSIRRVEDLAERERTRALQDDLTGLGNRTLLEERLDYIVLQAHRRRENFVLLILDLVRFKEINDSLGHFYGDFVLQKVSERLAEQIRDSDTLARMGGDEFAIILPQMGLDSAVKHCQKIAAAIEEPFMIEGNRLNVGVSIGMALYPDHGLDSETLIHQADMAMYEAKKNNIIYAVYHPSQDTKSLDRLLLLGEIREALTKGDLVLHFQPKVSPAQKTLIGVEALVRWNHKDRGLILPGEFIPLVEQAGLSRQLTFWVLDHALEQIRTWQESGLQIPVAVNLSVKNLHDLNFPNDLVRILKKWNVLPHQLILEVTESCMMVDPERVSLVVNHLHELGFHLSIDDFGTGYSSLSYLRKFPAREIKIDRSFVTDMCQDEENAIIVRSTIDMVHNIGCTVVAEGVEDDQTCQHLADLGCDLLQGFHICRPMNAENLNAWLETGQWSSSRLFDPAHSQ